MKLAPFGPSYRQTRGISAPQKHIHTPTKLVNLLLVKNGKFLSYTCRISRHDRDQMCVVTHFKGCIYNVDGITASGVDQRCGHTTDLQPVHCVDIIYKIYNID